jgi:hypothetical protein
MWMPHQNWRSSNTLLLHKFDRLTYLRYFVSFAFPSITNDTNYSGEALYFQVY